MPLALLPLEQTMITFTHTDLDEHAHERSAHLFQAPFEIEIAYQESEAGGWAIVVLVHGWDQVFASGTEPVAAGLSDAELVELARGPLATAHRDAREVLAHAGRALDQLFSS
jgi:hypothetical protein